MVMQTDSMPNHGSHISEQLSKANQSLNGDFVPMS